MTYRHDRHAITATVCVDPAPANFDPAKEALGRGVLLAGIDGRRPTVTKEQDRSIADLSFLAYRTEVTTGKGQAYTILSLYHPAGEQVVLIMFIGEADVMQRAIAARALFIASITTK